MNINLRFECVKIEGRKLTLQHISDDKTKFDMHEEYVDDILIYMRVVLLHTHCKEHQSKKALQFMNGCQNMLKGNGLVRINLVHR